MEQKLRIKSLTYNNINIPIEGTVGNPLFHAETLCEIVSNQVAVILEKIPINSKFTSESIAASVAGTYVDKLGIRIIFTDGQPSEAKTNIHTWMISTGFPQILSQLRETDDQLQSKIQQVMVVMDHGMDQYIFVTTTAENSRRHMFRIRGVYDADHLRQQLGPNEYVCFKISCENFKQFLDRIESQIGMFRNGFFFNIHFDDLKEVLNYIKGRFEEEIVTRRDKYSRHMRNTIFLEAPVPERIDF